MGNLVSIITPMYNAANYIEETIKSVQNQNYNNWEHIVIDDFSTDDSREIVEKYARDDDRIKLVKLRENKGVAYARNKGIHEAKGEYIAFLDSDDRWKENKLEKHIEYMEKNNICFSYTAYDVCDKYGKYIKTINPQKKVVNYKDLLKANVIACCTVIIKKEYIEKMKNIGHEDYATWLTILRKHNIKAYCLNSSLSIYRKVNNSVSSNKFKTIGWTWNIYRNNQKLGIIRSIYYINNFIIRTSIKYIKK